MDLKEGNVEGALPSISMGLSLGCVSGSQRPPRSNLRSGSDCCMAVTVDKDALSPSVLFLWPELGDGPRVPFRCEA